MFPFSLWFCLLGLFNLGEVSRGGGGGGGGGATLSLVGEIVSSNQSPKMGSLSSSAKKRHIFEMNGCMKCKMNETFAKRLWKCMFLTDVTQAGFEHTVLFLWVNIDLKRRNRITTHISTIMVERIRKTWNASFWYLKRYEFTMQNRHLTNWND